MNPTRALGLTLLLAGPFLVGTDTAASPAPPSWLTEPLSLKDALNGALSHNSAILKSASNVEATNGIVLETRAIVWPQVRGSGSYQRVNAVEHLTLPGETTGINPPKDAWAGNIRVVQRIYEGGRLRSAIRTARHLQAEALAQHHAIVADTLLAVRSAYDEVLLRQQQILVQEASLQFLSQQLTNTMRRFEAGTVPRFDVLRGEVEVANARPRLIHAQNAYRIAKNDLANLLGLNIPADVYVDIPMNLTDKMQETPSQVELAAALTQARLRRPELAALREEWAVRQEDIIVARAGYLPALEIYGGYGARNPGFEDDFLAHLAGPNAGVVFSWDIYNGGLSQGEVMAARAYSQKARVRLDETIREVDLEVRTAYSNLIEAQQVLESQKKVQEQAEEALRLATVRYEAGTGTQLAVLDAQTALTQARTTQVQALRDYAVAQARLGRAIGQDAPEIVRNPTPLR